MENILRKPKHQVFVKIVFLKIGEINTVKEQFEAEVFIQARWSEKALDHTTTTDKVNFDSYWNPELLVQNVMGTPKTKIWKEVMYAKSGEAFIVEKRKMKGKFAENLELEDFPFDYQYLSILISSHLSEDELEIKEDDHDLSVIKATCFVDEQQWSLQDYVESTPQISVKEFSETKNIRFPVLAVHCSAVRKYGFFIWNIVVIMSIISFLSFATFAVSTSLPQNRLQLGFTLTLTGVTFRFVTNQSLPKISYLTRIDKYILCSMIFTFLVSVWHGVITLFKYDTDLQARMDMGAFIAFAVLYALFQIIFILSVVIKYHPDLQTQMDLGAFIAFAVLYEHNKRTYTHSISFKYDLEIQARLDHVDMGAFIAFVVLYALFKIIFILSVVIKILITRSENKKKEITYQAKATKILGENWKSTRIHNTQARRRPRRIGVMSLIDYS